MADQLVRAGLTAEMLRFWGLQVERVPSTDAQLSGFFAGQEPMVGLALLGPADIACYNLLDHCRSLQVASRTALLSGSTATIPIRLFMRPEIVVQTLNSCARELPPLSRR